MKKLILIALFLFSQLPGLAPCTETQIKIGVYQNEPKIFVDKEGAVRGIFADIIEYIAGEEEWEIEYVSGTWEQGLDRLTEGQIDLMVDVAYSEERESRFDFHNLTILNNWAQIYVPIGSDIESVLDLRDKKLAVLKGDISYSEFASTLEHFGIGCHFVEVDEFIEIFRLLDSKAVDAGLISRLFGLEHEKNFDAAKSPIICCPSELYYATLEGKNRELLETIDRHLSVMKADKGSVYHQSLNRWLGADYATLKRFPKWVWWILLSLIVAVAFFAFHHLILHLRVRSVTAELREKNVALQEEIVERKEAEEALAAHKNHLEGMVESRTRDLQESERKYRLIADNVSDTIWTLDLEENFTYLSPSVERLAGYTQEEAAHLTLADLLTPSSLKIARDSIRRRFAEGDFEARYLELEMTRKDGSTFWSEISSMPVLDEEGKVTGFLGVTRDITERIETQKALRESEERYRSIFENATVGIFRTTAAGRIITANPACAEILGRESVQELIEEVEDLSEQIYDDPADRQLVLKLIQEKEKATVEVRLHRKDAALIIAKLNTWMVKDDEGNLRFLEGFIEDITERKQAQDKLEKAYRNLRDTQAKLVQSEKMASLGMLAAGITHEFNNPISAIQSASETLKSGISKFEVLCSRDRTQADSMQGEVKRILMAIKNCQQVITGGTHRVAAIVQRLKSFARLDEAEIQQIKINENMEDTISVFQHELRPGVVLRKDFKELPLITCFPAKLNQLFLQLLKNANQACGNKGEILVSTRCNKEVIHIEISDTGKGIPREQLERIFDPGFTTWGGGVGVGLGLSICYQIVQEHHGEIEVDSEVGKGSTFTVILPMDMKNQPTV